MIKPANCFNIYLRNDVIMLSFARPDNPVCLQAGIGINNIENESY